MRLVCDKLLCEYRECGFKNRTCTRTKRLNLAFLVYSLSPCWLENHSGIITEVLATPPPRLPPPFWHYKIKLKGKCCPHLESDSRYMRDTMQFWTYQLKERMTVRLRKRGLRIRSKNDLLLELSALDSTSLWWYSVSFVIMESESTDNELLLAYFIKTACAWARWPLAANHRADSGKTLWKISSCL